MSAHNGGGGDDTGLFPGQVPRTSRIRWTSERSERLVNPSPQLPSGSRRGFKYSQVSSDADRFKTSFWKSFVRSKSLRTNEWLLSPRLRAPV